MGFMRLAAVLFVVCCCAASAAPKAQKPVDIWLKALTTVDEQGHIVALDWEAMPPIHALIAERVAPKVKAWNFEPATVDGKPAQTRTGLMIHVLAQAQADDSLTLRFADAKTGPIAIAMQPPRYPEAAMVNMVSSLVTTQLEITAEGKPVIRDVQYVGSDGDRYRAAFLKASEDAIAGWTFHPETVAGVVVPTQMRIPIQFCMEQMPWCKKHNIAPDKIELPADVHMASESAIALKTDIRAQVI